MSQRNPDPIDKHIGLRLRARRLALGITQVELGDKLEISFQQIQKYEKGTDRLSGSRLYRIADIFDVAVGYFYEGAPAPGKHAARKEAHDDTIDRFMASNDGIMIAQAFVRIADARVRHTIASSVAELSKALAPKGKLQAAE